MEIAPTSGQKELDSRAFGNAKTILVFPSLRAVVDCLCQGLSNLDTQPEVVKSLTGFDWIRAPQLK